MKRGYWLILFHLALLNAGLISFSSADSLWYTSISIYKFRK
ncbi:hypothetical protein HMPREF0549_0297 [Limosilactobacillus vaginalis DSM 5837 = ATCC 49540]|uniref:Uncharacterized protein n=1 Tax=Limosilactobacillus vaginalis DSM 5837 = ATCC 49540 TaxID=1423814 RepID=C2ES61_9LACO|nr:hypothetical protein HMPREF0549_0297 [Limosilactobacillus vaginalis DSM 5837 = ATCC 49540]